MKKILISLIGLLLLATFHVSGQGITVKGTVKDASTGEPVVGAVVQLKGNAAIYAMTSNSGEYSIPAPSDGVLTVSLLGYVTKDVSVNGQKLVNIALFSDTVALDELVVVGYGTVKRSDLTGAVGSVDSDVIVSRGATSLASSIQGSVAGVNITQSSSRPGDSFSIQIRGKSSLNSNSEPLYVIDGVVCDNMDFLNPMDIDKVDILKDASSTAIYGSRATSGVVMISTKKGGSGDTKISVSYDGYWGYKTKANMPEFMDGTEFMKFRFSRYLTEKRNAADGSSTFAMSEANLKNVWGGDSQIVKNWYINRDYTDWVSLVVRDGSEQNHFVNVSGSKNGMTYRFGLGVQDEQGVLYNSYNRWNMKAAVEDKISDRLTAGFSANFATSLKDNGSRGSVNNGFTMTPSMMRAYYWEGDNAGKLIFQPGKDAAIYPNGGGPTSTLNPLVDRQNSKDDTRSYDVMANIFLQYSPIKEFVLKTTFSPMLATSHRGYFAGAQTEERRGQGTNMVENYNNRGFSYTWDTQANFTKTLGYHNISVLGLVSVYQNEYEGDYIKVTNMPFDVGWYNLASGIVENKSSYYNKISMLSYVFRANYSYKDRYLLTVSSRWDGSSKFQKENRWGMFPSAAVAWRIYKEPWMVSTSKWLSNLKLRASFGVTGNNAGVGPYDTQSLANTKYYYNFGNTVANGYGYTMSNAGLTWEKTTEYDFGLDFGFLEDRITGSVDIYNRDSKDLLMDMQTPHELGSSSGAVVSNVGKVNNKGIEIQVNTVNLHTSDLYWTSSISFASNKNSIIELNGRKEDLVGNKWFIGQPIDVVYGYKYLGICTAEQAKEYAADSHWKTKFYEGQVIIEDKDGNGTINASDRQILGHAAPLWTGGFNSSLQWKDFDFSFSVYASQGSTVYSDFMRSFARYGSRGTQHIKIDYYIPDGAPILGDDGEVTTQNGTHYGTGIWPFPTSQNGTGGGTYYLDSSEASQFFVDNSFVKIKNIMFGYTFPKSMVSKMRISALRIYANIVNPFTFTSYKGFDPEWANASVGNGSGGPASRSYQIGLNLKF